MAAVTVESLKQKLIDQFKPIHLEVSDVSGGCGQSFNVVIVSECFEGKPLLQRHRLVNECLEEEITKIHAFTQKTYTPEQWAKINPTPS